MLGCLCGKEEKQMKKIVLIILLLLSTTFNFDKVVKESEQREEQTRKIKHPAETLSWEIKNPHRKGWTIALKEKIGQNIKKLDRANDIEHFCQNYRFFPEQERVMVWSELFVAIAFMESSWKPEARLKNPKLGIDTTTQKLKTPEGLLQLGYEDAKWNRECHFDWKKDQHLSETSKKKTILDPKKNLQCGVAIMTRQIQKRNKIVLGDNGAYWAVLKMDGKHQKIGQIKDMMAASIPQCYAWM